MWWWESYGQLNMYLSLVLHHLNSWWGLNTWQLSQLDQTNIIKAYKICTKFPSFLNMWGLEYFVDHCPLIMVMHVLFFVWSYCEEWTVRENIISFPFTRPVYYSTCGGCGTGQIEDCWIAGNKELNNSGWNMRIRIQNFSIIVRIKERWTISLLLKMKVVGFIKVRLILIWILLYF